MEHQLQFLPKDSVEIDYEALPDDASLAAFNCRCIGWYNGTHSDVSYRFYQNKNANESIKLGNITELVKVFV